MEQQQQYQNQKQKEKPSIILTPQGSEGEKDPSLSFQGSEGEKDPSLSFQGSEGEKDPSLSFQGRDGEKETTLSARVVSLLWGDVTGKPFEHWVALVRKRSGLYRPSGFPNRLPKMETRSSSLISSTFHSRSTEGQNSKDIDGESEHLMPSEVDAEPSLWERLGNAAMLDIESGDFSWDGLSSLHHTEHTNSVEHFEDEMNKSVGKAWKCCNVGH